MRLRKISWFVRGEQISYWLRQIIDLQDTDKSQYFAITEFNNCFIIQSPSLNILGKRSNLPFSCKSNRKKEKSTVSFTLEQNIICSQTLLDGIVHEQTIICRQVFVGHVVGSQPMKRKKNLLQMLICIIIIHSKYFTVSDWLQFPGSVIFHNQLALTMAVYGRCEQYTIDQPHFQA